MKRIIVLSCALVLLLPAVAVRALESPKALKVNVLTMLENLAPADDWVAHRIDKAGEHLTKSLEAELWQGDYALNAKGKKVFEEDKKAVHELQEIVKKQEVHEDIKTDVLSIVDILVMADKTLTSIVKAKAEAVPQYLKCYGEGSDDPVCEKVLKEIGKADKELQKAQEELDKEHPDKAIDHYKKAWEHAQKAWENAPKPKPFQFSFETASDELSVALQKVYEAYVTAPTSGEQIQYLNQRRSEGIEYLTQHSEEAVNRLIEESLRLDATNGLMLMFVYNTIGSLDTTQAANFLHDQAKRPLPDINSVSEVEFEELYMLRKTAVNQLGRLNAAGNILARQHILDLVSNGDTTLKRSAIKVFYDTSSSRWRAKRELRRYLSPDDEYMLYEIY